MNAQFEGDNWKIAFRAQELVASDAAAEKLARVSSLLNFDKPRTLYREGERSHGVLYFILNGMVTLSDQGGLSYPVPENKMIGEFPMLLPGQAYTVTAEVMKESVIAKVPMDEFRSIANDHPELWENMAKMLATRLKESNEKRRSA